MEIKTLGIEIDKYFEEVLRDNKKFDLDKEFQKIFIK